MSDRVSNKKWQWLQGLDYSFNCPTCSLEKRSLALAANTEHSARRWYEPYNCCNVLHVNSSCHFYSHVNSSMTSLATTRLSDEALYLMYSTIAGNLRELQISPWTLDQARRRDGFLRLLHKISYRQRIPTRIARRL